MQGTINDIAPIKDIRIKGNTKQWFDSNMIGLIRKRDQHKKKFLPTKLNVDYEYFKEQRNIVQREIKRKKVNYVKEQVKKNTNNPKQLSNLGVYAKFPISQTFVSGKITCYSSMKRKMPIPSLIFTETQLWI